MDTIDRINKKLSEIGMSGAELTRAIGLKSTGVWSQWNKRLTKPSMRNMEAIATVLHCSVADLLSDEKPATDGDGLTMEEIELIQIFRSASPETRSAMLHLLRSAEAAQSVPGDGEVDR